MGTMLIAAGLRIDQIPAAAWHHGPLVGRIHRQYVDAGADIVTTCTFTLPSRAPMRRDTIRAAVETAREAGAPRIAASVGPAQASSRADILHHYADVIETFLDCGTPDCFLAETVMSASHARIIHEIIRSNIPGHIMPPRPWADSLLRAATPATRILGGCCGTTPAHIAALRDRLISD